MSDPTHLYEADKHRITNEAKVRTALEQPDFAQKEFEKWRASKERDMEREAQRDLFVNAWAKVAWLAEGRTIAMGRELAKLQHRIGRQRKANREQLRALRETRERVDELEAALESKDEVLGELRHWFVQGYTSKKGPLYGEGGDEGGEDSGRGGAGRAGGVRRPDAGLRWWL